MLKNNEIKLKIYKRIMEEKIKINLMSVSVFSTFWMFFSEKFLIFSNKTIHFITKHKELEGECNFELFAFFEKIMRRYE